MTTITKKTTLLAPTGPHIMKVTKTADGAPDGQISASSSFARLYIQNMPGVENPENEISVTWTKADSSTVIKGRSQIDFLDVSHGYIMPEIPEDLAVGDHLTVKATYNGVDTNVKDVTVVA